MGLDDDWEAGCDAIEDEFGDVESPGTEEALCDLEDVLESARLLGARVLLPGHVESGDLHGRAVHV
jgi:hypothetical protein